MKKWIIKEKKNLFRGRLYDIQDLYCAHPEKSVDHNFHIIETRDWINVVAVTAEGKYLMVKQHRLGTDEITIETPAGVINDREDPGQAARRELLEETGFAPREIVLIGKFAANPSIMNNYIYIYYASGCKEVASQNLDDSEDIEVALYTEKEIRAMIKSGEIDHSIAITALCLCFLCGNGTWG